MKTIELRQLFLDFFNGNGHEVVPSSPLVPGNDPTLLFTNSGMVQFKDVFTGQDSRPFSRAVTAQRCVRAGGKHNDLENVGYTARHHTFFEMLGNFSFGDYFKQEAIHFAWELLTRNIGLDKDRLWVTIYQDDDEAADVWLNEIGVPSERFKRIATSDNFWAMGDTGPCGPCTEIFYDHGPEVEGGPPGTENEDGDRYVELWNLVFMQYERFADGSMKPLPKPSVDTGMGLERIAAVMQNVYSNYDIDLFRALIESAATALGTSDLQNKALRVIADHIRSAAFLITDDVTPSNETRGYVLRRIIRRAIRHGYQLGCRQPFFHQLTSTLVEQMGDAYPELRHAQDKVRRVLLREEQKFLTTLDAGIKILDREIAQMSGEVLAGDIAFRLYDTYGFPLDLTEDYLREWKLTVDKAGFDDAMAEQRRRSKLQKFSGMQDTSGHLDVTSVGGIQTDAKTVFRGYELDEIQTSVAEIQRNGKILETADATEPAILILSESPFYAESGGQVGDTGIIESNSGVFRVDDTQYLRNKVIGHIGRVAKGEIKVNQFVTARVDAVKRNSTRKNHSATHLLHAALKNVLGAHVQQKGSLVAPDRLRFDFSHDTQVTDAEIEEIETQVNEQIRDNAVVSVSIMALEQAKIKGAAALFGEKYDSEVRVIGMGDDYSLELCGGTHVARAGDIGFFKIVQESSIASGIRRLEALTGEKAVERVQSDFQSLANVAKILKSNINEVVQKVEQLIQKNKKIERQLSDLETRIATGGVGSKNAEVQKIGDIRLLVTRQDDVNVKDLRKILAGFQQQIGSGVIVMGSVRKGKATLMCTVSKDLLDRLHAGKIIKNLSSIVSGSGGGKPHMAQGGGPRGEKIDLALQAVPDLLA